MKKIQKNIILFLMIVFFFAIGTTRVSAESWSEKPNSDRKCSEFFDIIDVVYGENQFSSLYDDQDLNGTHWIDGKQVITEVDNKWTSSNKYNSNTTVWYYWQARKNFSDSAKLQITVYNKNNSNICTETITGFNKNENHFKVRLQHINKSQWINIKGTFTDSDNETSSTHAVFTEIKVDNTAPLIALKAAGDPEIGKNDTHYKVKFTAIATDPKGWGKWKKWDSSLGHCKYTYTKDKTTSTKDCRISSSINVEGKNLVFYGTVNLEGDLETLYNSGNKITITVKVVAVKSNDMQSSKELSFTLDGTSKKVENTTTTVKNENGVEKDENGNKLCHDGTYIDEKGNCPEVDVGNSWGDITKAGLVQGPSKNTTEYSKSNGTCTDISNVIDSYWKYVTILIPIVLILLITIDFVKAIVASDAEQLKKSASTAVKRTVATTILLILPVLLSVILKWFGLELCL